MLANCYTLSPKNIPQYVFKQLPQSWFNINNFWYKESSHITCDSVKTLGIEYQLRFSCTTDSIETNACCAW